MDIQQIDGWESSPSGGWQWRDSWQGGKDPSDGNSVDVCFTGKGLPRDPGEAASLLLPGDVEGAWLKQVHGADVLDAGPGNCGEGDGLVTDRLRLGLGIVTADCVPVLLADETQVAAVHAGWRGVVGRVVVHAAERFPSGPAIAWVGPAISGEVYEVSDEVADQVVASANDSVRLPGQGERPHVDLQRAVEIQLETRWNVEIRRVPGCTLTMPDRLWSYRREGVDAGRNMSWIWRRPTSA